MGWQQDSTDYLIEASVLDREMAEHAARRRERELRIHLGDSWPLIQAKLAECEQYVDARMDLLMARLDALERANPAVIEAVRQVREAFAEATGRE